MGWEINIHEDSQALQAVCDGHLSADDLTMMAIEICHQAREHRNTQVLLDFSKARIDFSIPDVSDLPDLYREYGLSTEIRAALLFSHADRHAKCFAEFAKLSKDAGYTLNMFTSNHEAWAWLRSTGP